MNALDSNAAVTSSVVVSNVAVQLNVANSISGGNAHIWYFDNTGTVTFPDNTTQTTAYIDSFTMGNAVHWTSNVYTVANALNQLAARIWAIEHP
jgi:hypothetical protein